MVKKYTAIPKKKRKKLQILFLLNISIQPVTIVATVHKCVQTNASFLEFFFPP